jgi:hypothetical protein
MLALALFRTYTDIEKGSINFGLNATLALNETINESILDVDASRDVNLSTANIKSSDDFNIETSFNQVKETFENKSSESERFLKDIYEFIHYEFIEPESQSIPAVIEVDQNKLGEQIEEKNSKTSLDLETGKITTTIKLNSFITIKSTIVTNGIFLGKQLDNSNNDNNKLAEATFDIAIPQLNINVSVSTDIQFDSDAYAKINETQK